MMVEYIQTRVEGAAKKSWVFKETNKEYCTMKDGLLSEVNNFREQRREPRGERNLISSSQRKCWPFNRECIGKPT